LRGCHAILWSAAHPMNESAVREYLVCPACRQGSFDVAAFERDGDEIVHGVLRCGGCRAWYRVEDRLPVLVLPALRDPGRERGFAARFRARWEGWDEPVSGPADAGAALKLEQIAFFRAQAPRYDRRILDSSFWNAFDLLFLDAVRRESGRRGVLVEIGAGTGRFTSALRRDFDTVIHADLSEEMVREAMGKAAPRTPGPGRVIHLVADAERLPLRDGAADCALFSGVLSYLPSPAVAIGEAARVLAGGGCLVGQENNRSAFRPLFDLLMAFRKSWVAKSCPARAVLSRRELRAWCRDAGVPVDMWTEVFLPPHLFNLLPPSGAVRLMRATNALGRRLPWFWRQGGLVLFSGDRLV